MIDVKRASGLALAVLISAASVMPVQAFGESKWTIGYEKNTNGPEKKVQGANGWYFMYTEDVNTGGRLDTSKVKECVWADTGSCWLWYDYDEMWMPDIYASEDYDCLTPACWWRMDGNGIMDPNIRDNGVSSVIAWEAPKDGTYSIHLDYTAGSMLFDWTGKEYDGGDGLTLRLCTDTEALDQMFCGVMPASERKAADNMPSGSLSGETRLQKGEKIYIMADPGADGGSDIATIKMEITREEGESARDFWRIVAGAGTVAVVLLAAMIVFLVLKWRKAAIESGDDWDDWEDEE